MHDSAPEDWRYRLQAPAIPEAVAWSRTFGASLARSFGVDHELSADLKLAISELVSEIIVAHPRRDMTIRARAEGDRLVLQISPWSATEPDDRDLTAWDIASSLFEIRLLDEGVEIGVSLAPGSP